MGGEKNRRWVGRAATLKPLTARQQEVYDFLASYIAARGRSPTLRLIAANFRFGIRAAADHLILMARKGALTWEPGKATTIRLLALWPEEIANIAGERFRRITPHPAREPASLAQGTTA